MKTLTKMVNSDVKITRDIYSNKVNEYPEDELTNLIIDSFNEQISLNNKFKEKFGNMMDAIDFTYPKDVKKLKEMMDSFFESSHKLSGNYMKNILDLHTVFKHEETIQDRSNQFSRTMSIIKNNEWMEDWIEQMKLLKHAPEVLSQVDDDMNDFWFYATVTERN